MYTKDKSWSSLNNHSVIFVEWILKNYFSLFLFNLTHWMWRCAECTMFCVILLDPSKKYFHRLCFWTRAEYLSHTILMDGKEDCIVFVFNHSSHFPCEHCVHSEHSHATLLQFFSSQCSAIIIKINILVTCYPAKCKLTLFSLSLCLGWALQQNTVKVEGK